MNTTHPMATDFIAEIIETERGGGEDQQCSAKRQAALEVPARVPAGDDVDGDHRAHDDQESVSDEPVRNQRPMLGRMRLRAKFAGDANEMFEQQPGDASGDEQGKGGVDGPFLPARQPAWTAPLHASTCAASRTSSTLPSARIPKAVAPA